MRREGVTGHGGALALYTRTRDAPVALGRWTSPGLVNGPSPARGAYVHDTRYARMLPKAVRQAYPQSVTASKIV